MKPEFHPSARAELVAAIRGGAKHGPDVGEALRAEVMRVASLLCDYPNMGELQTLPYRKFPLGRFPFSIIFRADGELLRIVAVAHNRKLPGYWSHRA